MIHFPPCLRRCSRILLTPVLLAFTITSVGCGVRAPVSGTADPAKTLAAVAVSPAAVDVAAGSTAQLAATAKYKDGSTADVTSQASWSSAAAGVATVSTSGTATGITAGSATVTATLNGMAGSAQIRVPADIPPAAKTVRSLALSPATASLAQGATQQLAATATYSDGSEADVTSQASWASSNAAAATAGPAGVVQGVGGGMATITAVWNGASGSAQVTVPAAAPAPKPAPPVTVTTIALSPSGAGLAVGATQQLAATATYSDGSTADVTGMASWASSKASIATVNAAGLATGVAPGTVTMTAIFSGATGATLITVPQPPKTLTRIAVSPSAASVAVGAAQQLTATAQYSDGTTADVSAAASWVSSKASIATVNVAGLATGVAPGTATVTATLNGASGTALITVPQPPKTLLTLLVSPLPSSFTVGSTQQLTATAQYSDGTTADVTPQTGWTSSNTAIATVSAAGLVTGVAQGSAAITGTLESTHGSAALTVTPKVVSAVAVTPNPAALALGATQQLTATATYKDGSTADVSSSVSWNAANSAVASVSSSGLLTPAAAGSTTVTASLNGVSGHAPVAVAIAPGTGVSIPTWQGNAGRSGLNAGEASLSPANVSAGSFGKLFSYQLDGYVYGEPLLMSGVNVKGTAHNVLYAATEKDSVYALDGDSYGSGAPLWQVSLLQPGEAPMTTGPIKPYQGVTSTPVIDPASKTLYVVSAQQMPGSHPTFRLHALDIATGAERFGGPVTLQASVPGTNVDAVDGTVSLTTSCVQRAALLLANGTVYIGFGGCHSGWLLAYDAHTLAQTGVFNASPNLNGEGPYASAGGIWMGGGGPAADSNGNVYVSTGNGPWDGNTAFSDSVLKFDPQLKMLDSFTPSEYAFMNCQDADLAAGGVLLLPGTSKILAGGKTGRLYLLDTRNLGKEQPNDAGADQTLFFESDLVNPYPATCTDPSGAHTATINSYEIFGTGAYFNGSVYLGVTPTGTGVPGVIRQFPYSGKLTPYNHTTPGIEQHGYGTTPFLSADGTGNGILWMIDHGQPLQTGATPTAATLRAFDANDLTRELYNSGINVGDAPGFGIKFTSPIVANGKVYLSTGHDPTTTTDPHGELDVYGLR